MKLFDLIFGNEYDDARNDAKDMYLHNKLTKEEYILLLDRISEEEESNEL